MKKLSLALFALLVIGCTPFQWVDKPVKMNHAVTFYTDSITPIGYVLCHNYRVIDGQLILDSAGYYPKLKKQRAVAGMTFPPYWKYTITTFAK